MTELSPDDWVYEGLMSYVFTHQDMEDTENIKFVSDSLVSLIHQLKMEEGKDIWICGGASVVSQLMRESLLKMEEGKDIWICGGASVVSQLMRESLIDRFHIAIIPTLLGSGVRLFDPHCNNTDAFGLRGSSV